MCGISSQQIQKRLLVEVKLKFTKAAEIAVAMETATQDTTDISDKRREEKQVNELTMNNHIVLHFPRLHRAIVVEQIPMYKKCVINAEKEATFKEFVEHNKARNPGSQPGMDRGSLFMLLSRNHTNMKIYWGVQKFIMRTNQAVMSYGYR